MMLVQTKRFSDACALLIAPAGSKSCHDSHRMIIRGATGVATMVRKSATMCVCRSCLFIRSVAVHKYQNSFSYDTVVS